MERINQTFEQGKDAYQKLVKSQKRKRKNKKQFTEWKSRVKPDEISVGTVSYRLVKLLYSKEATYIPVSLTFRTQMKHVINVRKFNPTQRLYISNAVNAISLIAPNAFGIDTERRD